nr:MULTISPECIES: radical SAM protein [unclassified Neglectibacter]
MEEIASSQLEDLLLQVTQNCNLRCEYCTYSGKYYNRTHSTNHMSFEVASQSVDFFMERAKDKNSVVIGFYGGEPLLEFELIKRVVSYVEENYGEKKVSYGMTTNGTLLTEDVVTFLIEKHFNIIISLDGPKDQHDKYRRFVSGKGSFDVVMENMQRIRTLHPVFYQNLRTNTVVTPDKDLEALEVF